MIQYRKTLAWVFYRKNTIYAYQNLYKGSNLGGRYSLINSSGSTAKSIVKYGTQSTGLAF
ncbi:hypothetical protein [Hathewaya massiliensis]|uniref:hypothetical protein n=1 Tax=Hathewaya massiliensis TaxID=1964382 RepID=UPI00115C2482|nr:hypothetical protein [Hathewaya massiliensis]